MWPEFTDSYLYKFLSRLEWSPFRSFSIAYNFEWNIGPKETVIP